MQTVYRLWSPLQTQTPIGWQVFSCRPIGVWICKDEFVYCEFVYCKGEFVYSGCITIIIAPRCTLWWTTMRLHLLLYKLWRSNIQSPLSEFRAGCFANLMIVHVSPECMASPAITFCLSGHEFGCYADLIIVIRFYWGPGIIVITRNYVSSRCVTREPECS